MIATIVRIARHELRHAWRTGTLIAAGALVTALLVGAAVVGQARHALDQTQRARFQALVEEQWRTQPDRHPHRVSHYGYLLFRPRAPLGFFDDGLERFTGTTIFLEAHRQNTANFGDVAQDSGSRRFGDLTMAMVLQMLVPLLLVGVAGVSVAREREAGTLPLVLSQSASWASFLCGKVCGSVLIVAAMVCPGAIATIAWIGRAPIDGWDADVSTRAILLAGSSAAYLVACAALAVLISARHRTSRDALVTLVGLWLVLWVIVPRALPSLAASLYPLPSRAAFDADVERHVRTLGDSHNPDDPTFASLRARTLATHGVTRLDDLPFNYNGLVMTESEKMTAAAYREHMERLHGIYRQQARLVGLTGMISPYVAIRTVSTGLAGVDIAHVFEFERQAEEYRFALVQHLNGLHTNDVAFALDRYRGVGENAAPTRERIAREHWQATPSAHVRWPTVQWALAQQPLAAVGLFWWLAVVVAGFLLVARRPALVM